MSIKVHFLSLGLVRGVSRQYTMAITASRVTGEQKDKIRFLLVPFDLIVYL